MSALRFLRRPSLTVLALAIAATALSACKPDAPTQTSQDASLALPLTTTAAQPVTTAPAVTALPDAPRPRIVRVNRPADNYAYVEQAYAMSDAIGQAPPDYGFSYADAHPWVWRSHGSDMRIVEPVSGGDRYYFYRSGASDPYLVRDPQYAFAYSDGQLVMVFDRQGRPLSPDQIDQLADGSGRYLMRGRSLRAAAMQDQREQVNAANWAARRANIAAAHADWAAEEARSEDWRTYRTEHEAEEQAYWQGERAGRQQAAQNFDHWREQRYEGPPPPVQTYDRGASDTHTNLAGPAVVVAALAGALALNHKHKDTPQTPPHPNDPGQTPTNQHPPAAQVHVAAPPAAPVSSQTAVETPHPQQPPAKSDHADHHPGAQFGASRAAPAPVQPQPPHPAAAVTAPPQAHPANAPAETPKPASSPHAWPAKAPEKAAPATPYEAPQPKPQPAKIAPKEPFHPAVPAAVKPPAKPASAPTVAPKPAPKPQHPHGPDHRSGEQRSHEPHGT